MSGQITQYPSSVEEMREAFDSVFAEPDRIRTTDLEDFLAIRVGERPFALRVAELVRIESARKIVALPRADAWLLGLASSQGRLIPVYDMELALGFDRNADEKKRLAICGRDEPIGLAFDSLEGYFRIPRTDIFSSGGGETDGKHDRQTVRGAGELRPVINLPQIIATIRSRVSSHSVAEET